MQVKLLEARLQRLKRLNVGVYEPVLVCACALHIGSFSRFSRCFGLHEWPDLQFPLACRYSDSTRVRRYSTHWVASEVYGLCHRHDSGPCLPMLHDLPVPVR